MWRFSELTLFFVEAMQSRAVVIQGTVHAVLELRDVVTEFLRPITRFNTELVLCRYTKYAPAG